MVLASISVFGIEQALENGHHHCLCFQGESQLPPACLGVYPRSASGCDTGSFQINASTLGFRVYGILHVAFKCRVSFFYSPLDLPYTSPS